MRNRTMQNRTNEWRRVEAWKPDEHGVVSLRRTRGGTRPRTAHSAWRAHMMLRGAASCGGQGPLSSTLGVPGANGPCKTRVLAASILTILGSLFNSAAPGILVVMKTRPRAPWPPAAPFSCAAIAFWSS